MHIKPSIIVIIIIITTINFIYRAHFMQRMYLKVLYKKRKNKVLNIKIQ